MIHNLIIEDTLALSILVGDQPWIKREPMVKRRKSEENQIETNRTKGEIR